MFYWVNTLKNRPDPNESTHEGPAMCLPVTIRAVGPTRMLADTQRCVDMLAYSMLKPTQMSPHPKSWVVVRVP